MKVLIIDDNKDITDMVSFYLESQNISCKVVNEGKSGLETIKRESFDLIILDLAMPVFSGLDIFNALGRDGLLQSIKVVIFTASSMPEHVQAILSGGADGILNKPPSIDELNEVIDRFRPRY
jgi:CheY-like chemotaxis protein